VRRLKCKIVKKNNEITCKIVEKSFKKRLFNKAICIKEFLFDNLISFSLIKVERKEKGILIVVIKNNRIISFLWNNKYRYPSIPQVWII
jgi:hypothetical protein